MTRLLVFAFLIVFPAVGYSQWHKSNFANQSQFNKLTASFLNKDTFLISHGGWFEQTLDGGKNFSNYTNYKSGVLNYLVYKSFDTIYGVGGACKEIHTSYDAGKTWFKQLLLMPNGDTAFMKRPVVFFGFFDSSNGIIFGDSVDGVAQVFLTNNGGQTWEFYAHPSINKIFAYDLSNIVIPQWHHQLFPSGVGKLLLANKVKLLTLSEYGKIWKIDSVTDPRQKPHAIAFKDELNGLALCNTVNLKTADGGETWIESPIESGSNGVSLAYVKATATHPDFYIQSKYEGRGSNISYDEGLSWQPFDSLKHERGTLFFKDAETGVCSEVDPNSSYSLIYYYNPDDKPTNTGTKSIIPETERNYGYPNPANTEIMFNKPLNGLQLFDIHGKLINTAANTNRLDVSEVPNGMYWLKAADQNQQTLTQKVLIQH